MKILITGSSGFIGFHLTKALLDQGHEVVGIDNHNDYYDISLKEHRNDMLKSANFKFYLQDINKISIPDTNFDLAINLAAQAGVRVSTDKEHLYRITNILGFQAFCNFCNSHQINKIIYASSSSVYCDYHTRLFSEEKTRLNPKSKYGISKLQNEVFATKFSKSMKISFIGLRFFSVYGPLGRPDMAYYLFTDAIKKKKTIFLNNGGRMSRDMTYIDDIVDGIKRAIRNILREDVFYQNEIFNLGNNYPVSTLNLLECLQKKLNKSTEIVDTISSNEANTTNADITKSRKILGYNPRIKFEDGINSFLDWHEEYERNKKT
jgi:UDP-glucuronate 4-epimerase